MNFIHTVVGLKIKRAKSFNPKSSKLFHQRTKKTLRLCNAVILVPNTFCASGRAPFSISLKSDTTLVSVALSEELCILHPCDLINQSLFSSSAASTQNSSKQSYPSTSYTAQNNSRLSPLTSSYVHLTLPYIPVSESSTLWY